MVDRLSEAFQYYLLRASCDVAEEKGKCEYFHRTKYAEGLLPIDHYKKEIDEIVPHKQRMAWETLRKDIAKHGLRHSTLSAQMPEILLVTKRTALNPRAILLLRKVKKVPLKQIGRHSHFKNAYTLLWDMGSQ